MSTSSTSTTQTSTRNFRLVAHAFLLISTNSLTLCLLYSAHISPSKQHFGFSTRLAILQTTWLIISGLVLVVSLCYLISSYYRGHQRRMIAAAARHDLETGVRIEVGRGGGGGGGGGSSAVRRGETGLIAGPPYELQRRPASIFARALAFARRGGGGAGRDSPPSPTLVLEGGGMNVVREKERRHGPVLPRNKPLPPNPPTEGGGEDDELEQQRRRRVESWQQAPVTIAPPLVNNFLRVPRKPVGRPGSSIYQAYGSGTSGILPFGQPSMSSGGSAPGVRVGEQDGIGDDESDSLGSQPLYANGELREVIGRYS
ncbi:hypothetical protein L873DRAFT_1790620 [Choiromyces venosus 120613-1]|uniref:Uncharacterized protein n=1 Tax=Choiromyces venosus 120613-1 TaxID=1336337 RepID=A0A3N4JI12_9PEZI|nr:hypothetical protein L873DRAFT_1790620 [Choiromyces venosus 120613-1]